MHISRIAAVALLAISIGCAPPSSTKSGTRNSQAISQDEISEAGQFGNAYDMISRLRPNFLRSRGETSVLNSGPGTNFPNVYIDGLLYGDINSLRNINASQIAQVRMYQSGEAQTKFGTGNSSGVIEIIYRK